MGVIDYGILGPVPAANPAYVAKEVRTVSSTGGEKGSKLARFDLIPPQQLHRLAEHYGKGAEKYSDDNYRKGYPWKLSIAALERHLNAFKQGEDIDEETGSLHIIAAAWHCFTLAEFYDTHPEYDTRLKTVDQRAARKVEEPKLTFQFPNITYTGVISDEPVGTATLTPMTQGGTA